MPANIHDVFMHLFVQETQYHLQAVPDTDIGIATVINIYHVCELGQPASSFQAPNSNPILHTNE